MRTHSEKPKAPALAFPPRAATLQKKTAGLNTTALHADQSANSGKGRGYRFGDLAINSSPENSQGLPRPLQTHLERLSGVDLSGIRVHRNSSQPDRVNALAYTQGQEIHLAPGQERHLAHEAWHAVQQAQGRVPPTLKSRGMAMNQDAGLESEADAMGARAESGAPSTGTPSIPSAGPRGQATNGVLQRKLKLTGLTEEKRKAFVAKMSAGSALQFTLDAAGLVQQADATIVPTDEYGKQIAAAIKDAQTVNLNFINQDNTVFGDSFASGEVDYDDMIGMPERLFLSNVMHFIVERFAITDYEKSKSTATNADFMKAHGKGQEAQERQLKEWYPKKTIKYKGQGYDAASKVVDASGNGSIDYYFDFTGVKQVFKQNVVGGAVKESIISSKIVEVP